MTLFILLALLSFIMLLLVFFSVKTYCLNKIRMKKAVEAEKHPYYNLGETPKDNEAVENL